MGVEKQSKNAIERMKEIPSNADLKTWMVWEEEFIRNLHDLNAGSLMLPTDKNTNPNAEYRERIGKTTTNAEGVTQTVWEESSADYDRYKKNTKEENALHNCQRCAEISGV